MQQTPQYAVTSSKRYFSAVNTTYQVPAAMAAAAGILKVTLMSSLANNHAATAEGGHSAGERPTILRIMTWRMVFLICVDDNCLACSNLVWHPLGMAASDGWAMLEAGPQES